MKIKMLTTSAGPDINSNWCEGDVREVCVDEARHWYKHGVCKLIEPFPEDAEKMLGIVTEKAVVKPPETAVAPPAMVNKGKVMPPAEVAATGNTVTSAKAATWGTPEVK
jgi:hypothetical protein